MVAILVTVRARSTGCVDIETDEGVGVEADGVEFGSGEFGARGGALRRRARGEGLARAGRRGVGGQKKKDHRVR